MRLRAAAEVALACAFVPLALETLSAARVLGAIGRLPARGLRADDPERLAALVDRILYRLPWIWRHTCLRRAAVLASLLRRDGRDAEVVIGVRRAADGRLDAHAWLRCDGEEPYLESGDVATFAVLRGPGHVAP